MSFITELKNIIKNSSANQKILFKYTENLEQRDYAYLLNSKKINDKFYLSYPDKSSYIGLGQCIEITPRRKQDLIKEKLSFKKQYKIISNTNKHIKYFGGVSFNSESKVAFPWENIPKNYFVIPEFLIQSNPKNTTLTSFVILDEHTQIEYIKNNYNQFKNNINKTNKENSIIINLSQLETPNERKNYSQIFNSYIKKITQGKIEKIILSRMKTFFKSGILDKKNILNKLDPECTNFLFEFNKEKIFLGSTPEQLIKVQNNYFNTESIAGSIPITNTHNHAELFKILAHDNKELSEHNFVTKYIKKKLIPFSENINISQKELKILNHICHLRTPINGLLKPNIDIIDLLYTLYPTPAVLGIPKKYCLDLIKKHELFDRGWYGGCIGWFDLNGNGRFDVSIRSGLITNNRIHLFAGGGIVNQSSESNEWNETEVKFKHLLSKLN